MDIAATVANLAWFAANGPGFRRYIHSLRHPRRTQCALLEGYLRGNEDTALGRRLDFSKIRTVEDFQSRVPLSIYDDYEEDIERIMAGEGRVLTAEPVLRLQPSSGSTRAAKLIPYTAGFQREMRRALSPWMIGLARTHPGVIGGPAYWSVTPASLSVSHRSSRVPVGFEADQDYLGGVFGALVARTLIPCDDLSRLDDIPRFRKLTLLRLLRARELRLISVWHPAFLTLLLETLESHWGELLDDLSRGTEDKLTPPSPKRAAELNALPAPDPALIWPNLALISCWGGGHAGTSLETLKNRFPRVAVQPKGLLATEAFVTLPFNGLHPLAVCSHFFEFLDDSGEAHAAWDLERDEVYSVVVTTGAGLYRYRLQDQVRVNGYVEATPSLEFIGKEDRCSDLFGEKLSDDFVAGVFRRVFDQLDLNPWFFLLAPELSGDGARYVAYLGLDQPLPERFDQALEAGLRENPHYEYCVRLGQLKPAATARVAPGAAERYLAQLGAVGQRMGNIKPSVLCPLDAPGTNAFFSGIERPSS